MNRRIGNRQWREVISFYKEGKRMGLRTVGSVIKGEFIIEYVGEAIDQEKIPKNDLRCRDRSRWSYVMFLEKGICIDAGKKGGLARYINHSCDPNCSVDRWIVRGVPRLAIFARRDIVPGEELSYDYKWERDEEQDPTPCLCVSPLCRGTLEVAPKTSRRTLSPRQKIFGEEIFQPDGEVEVDEAKEHFQSQFQMRAVFNNDTTGEPNNNEKEEIKNLQEQNVVELEQDASSGAPTTSALLKKLNMNENMLRRNNKKGKTDYNTAREKKRWEAKFIMLQTFKKETGHCHVPKGYPQNTSLSSWVQQQRRGYKLFQEGKASSLCTTKLRKLEDVGFIFDGSKFKSKNIRLAELSIIPDEKYEKKWEAKFQMFQAFKKETGHCYVPKEYPQNTFLSSWVQRQRRAYKLFQEGKPTSLCTTRLRKLEDVGFIFDGSKFKSKSVRLAELSIIPDEKYEKKWEAKFQMFQAFKKETGHCYVPKEYPQNTFLSSWVQRQRRAYKLFQEGKPTSLCTTRLRKLEDVGFIFDGSKFKSKSVRLAELSIIPDEKIGKQWEAKFQMFQAFKKETGHCYVPRVYRPNTILSSWVQQQRRAYKLFQEGKDSPLCIARLRKLEDAGFIFDGSKYRSKTIRLAELSNITDDKRWERMFKMLQNFRKETGHCAVPFGYEPNKRLSYWVKFQRRLKRQGKLLTNKKRKLDEIGFIFDARMFKYRRNIDHSKLAKLCSTQNEKSIPTGPL
eukprot:CAMPEP_0194347682 /NCGR_PEP_ID=MMETSP0171-20130528/106127_1 /TAXON_ID=218684 /ORGANISM="Corethron pennatum, Strain L29A3" /LENGTH=732 /DNA_ID=CAMNT_0039114965 /DNA_START=271 /DNA_END=2469 /DNA_ORIENTATION=-